MSINTWMEKDVVHVYNGILLNHKKEWKNAICDNMNGPRDYHSEVGHTDETEQDPVGSWAQKPSCVFHSLFVGDRFQPPWPFLSSEGQISTVPNQGRVGMEKQGRSNKESTV